MADDTTDDGTELITTDEAILDSIGKDKMRPPTNRVARRVKRQILRERHKQPIVAKVLEKAMRISRKQKRLVVPKT